MFNYAIYYNYFLIIFLDEDEEPRCVQLTNQHKGAIRAIRKVIFVKFVTYNMNQGRLITLRNR